MGRMTKAVWVAALVMPMLAAAQDVKSSFGPGEQLTFKVRYLGMTAGTTTVTVGSDTKQWGSNVWPLVAVAKTENVFRLYPVRDKFISYWDPVNQKTLGSDMFADEGNKKRRQRIKIDHDSKKAQVIKQDEGKDEREGSYDLTEGSMDVASAAFALRNQPLEVGKSFEMPVFTGQKEFKMTAKVQEKTTLKTPIGDKEVFKVAVATEFSGGLAAKRDIFAYFTTDPSHVIVKIEAEFGIGTLEATLTEYKEGKQLASSAPNGG